MKLNYKKYGTEGQILVILHGLFGSTDNWMSVAKKLEDDYQVYTLDLRNHGQSPWSDDWDYEVMSEDIKEFITEHQISNFMLLGHSLGGKVAMNYACKYGTEHNLQKLIIVDISTRAYPIHHEQILKALTGLDLSQITSRKEADDALKAELPELGVRQFLLKNLQRNEDNSFSWQVNLEIINQKIANVGDALPINYTFEDTTLFIKGENSNYIHSDELSNLQKHFPKASLQTISKAGHWVHAEKQTAFLSVLESFLDN